VFVSKHLLSDIAADLIATNVIVFDFVGAASARKLYD
jgi:hypothetical protein